MNEKLVERAIDAIRKLEEDGSLPLIAVTQAIDCLEHLKDHLDKKGQSGFVTVMDGKVPVARLKRPELGSLKKVISEVQYSGDVKPGPIQSSHCEKTIIGKVSGTIKHGAGFTQAHFLNEEALKVAVLDFLQKSFPEKALSILAIKRVRDINARESLALVAEIDFRDHIKNG